MDYKGNRAHLDINEAEYDVHVNDNQYNITWTVFKRNSKNKIAELICHRYDKTLKLQSIYVEEDYQRRGIATHLIGQAIKYAETNGYNDNITTIAMGRTDRKILITFYSKYTYLNIDNESKMLSIT